MDTKKIIGLLAIVFFGFWMFTDPSGLAVTAKDAGAWTWDLLTETFAAIIDFVGAMG